VALEEAQQNDSQENTPGAEEASSTGPNTLSAPATAISAGSSDTISLSPQSTVSSTTSQPPPSVDTITTSVDNMKTATTETTSCTGSGEPLPSVTDQLTKDEK